jgi:hypothetical protein
LTTPNCRSSLAVRGHHPESDGSTGSGHVRVKALRHEDDVAFVHDRRELGLAAVRYQLHTDGAGMLM